MSGPRRHHRFLFEAAVLFIVYVGAAWLGFRLAFSNPHVTAVWPPTGVAVAALFLFGARLWPAVWAGAVVANLLSGASPELALAISVGNTLAPLLAVQLLRRTGFRPTLERPSDVYSLFIGGGFVPMLVSATLGTASLAIAHALGGGGFTLSWTVWWIGDSMGVVIFAPVIMTLASVRPNPMRQRPVSALALFTLTIAGGWLLFLTHMPLGYLAPMFFFAMPAVAALQFQQSGATLSTALMATMAFITTVTHTGLGQQNSPTTQLLVLQAFNVGLAITALSLAAVMRQRLNAESSLRAAADELGMRFRERSDLLQESQRLAHIGSFRWDAKTNANTWTDELYRIYGLEPGSEAPSFEAYMSKIHPEFVEGVQRSVDEAIAERRPFEHEYRINHPSGEERWVHAYGEIVTNGNGKMLGLQGTCQDITDRIMQQRTVEDTLRDAYERERDAAEHLRSLDESKTVFLEAVSHELRTPLTVIFGVASLLQTGDLRLDDAQTPDLLHSLDSSAHRLQSLLDDLLDLDRLRRGVLIEPKRRPTPVADLMARVVNTLELGRHPVHVDAHEVVANIDPAQTERIVENLVVNGLKHTPPETTVWIRAERADGGVLIVVEDSGPGVPGHIRQALFEPFVKETRGHVPGTGIGLSLVQRFAQLHGGRAWVEDRDGGGASFKVYLPDSADNPAA